MSPVLFRSEGWEWLGNLLHRTDRAIILHDGNTARCMDLLHAQCPSAAALPTIGVPAGEQYKNIETCTQVWNELTELGADRHSLLINLGGGVVTDLGGFAASTYMRGISFVHVPTSLMGMVDAAIGGKTAVDLGPIKNRVGLFSQPEAVIIDRGFLQTLPEKEYRNGMAEVLKHAFISDVELLKNLNDEESLIERSVRVKSVIVRKDEHETGERRKLNFGHTIGHAIESHFLDQGKAVTHGEAVAAGMLMEAYISSMVSGLTETDLSMVCQHIDQLFPRIELSDTEWHMIKKFLYHDKKNRNGKLQFVLLKELGKAEIDRELREDVLNKAFVFYTSVK